MRGSDRSPPLFLSCAGGVTDGDLKKKRCNTSFGFLSFSFMDLLLSLQIFFLLVSPSSSLFQVAGGKTKRPLA
jgi:hypothetical protein